MHTTARAGLGVVLAVGLASAVPTRAVRTDCSSAPDGRACSDGNQCTTGDQCQSGVCVVPATFAQPAGSPIGVAELPFSAEAGDFNRDGKPDLVVIDYTSHEFTILLGNGAGGFAQPPGSPVPTIAGNEQTLTTADFNVDGNLDVAVVHAVPGLVSVYLGDGAGAFTPAGPAVPAGSGPGVIAAGEFNRDGKPDLVVVDGGPRELRVLLGNGAGGFTEAPDSPVSAGNGPGLAVGDFNLDGNLDLAEGDIGFPDSVIILLGDGTGRFTHAPTVPVASSAYYSLAVGDFNLDGKPDLATAGQLYVTVLLGDGHGGFVSSVVLTAPIEPGGGQGDFVAVSVGDFNVDHKPDIAVLNNATEEFSILLGDGSGGFVELKDPSFGPVSTPIVAPVADFNLDGKDDLAVANFSTSTIGVFLNNDLVPPDDTACDDGSACTTNDRCRTGACTGGVAVDCNDDNPCTNDLCDPQTGCAHVNNTSPCDDGNACTTGDTCSHGACHPGSPLTCDPPDSCHTAGTCGPGSGVCAYPAAPDGSTCDDGNPGTPFDSCNAGVCVGASCGATPMPKSAGYYKKLCDHGHGQPYAGDALTDADATCVGGSTATFAGISTVDEICNVIDAAPNGGGCSQAEDELMALAINVCRGRICDGQEIDSSCSGGPHDHTLTTVTASLATADAILADPSRSRDTCADARCLAREINNGQGMHHISLRVDKDAVGKLRLSWSSPVMDDGSGEASSYTIWRRPLGSGAAFVPLAITTGLTILDLPEAAGTEYEITFTIRP